MPAVLTLMGEGQNGQEARSGEGRRSRSCRPWSSSGLQTAEVRLPQDSVDVVIWDTSSVTMETVLQGAGRDFGLWADGVLGPAAVLAVYAWSGGGHYCSLWTADPIAAVTAGRLQTQNRVGVWTAASQMDAQPVNKDGLSSFWQRRTVCDPKTRALSAKMQQDLHYKVKDVNFYRQSGANPQSMYVSHLWVQIWYKQRGTPSWPLGLRPQLLVFLAVAAMVPFPVQNSDARNREIVWQKWCREGETDWAEEAKSIRKRVHDEEPKIATQAEAVIWTGMWHWYYETIQTYTALLGSVWSYIIWLELGCLKNVT